MIMFLGLEWSAGTFFINLYDKIFKRDKKLTKKQYREYYEKYDQDSKQKSMILTFLDQTNKEIPDLICHFHHHDWQSLQEDSKEIINSIVNQIPMLLKKNKTMNHRCAIFIPDQDETSQLKIFEGSGYSKKEKRDTKLSVENSFAGIAYITGNHQYSPDVRKEENYVPNPNSSKKYYSLLCTPIKIRDEKMGVLNIDGSEIDCFTDDDIDFMQFFSNQLAIILDLLWIRKNRREVLKDGQKEDQFTG